MTTLLAGHNDALSAEEAAVIVAKWPVELQRMFVISIRPERLTDFEKRLGPLCQYLTIVDGVDGHCLNPKRLQQQGIYEPRTKWNTLTRGELGCFLSHRAIWAQVVQQKLPYAMIMEDDCLLRVNHAVSDYVNQVMDELRLGDPDWRVLFLSRNPTFAKNKKRASRTLFQVGRSWGLFCYAISLSGARELLRRSSCITEAADVFVSTANIGGKYASDKIICGVNKSHSDTYTIR